jgi:hypothetical protein
MTIHVHCNKDGEGKFLSILYKKKLMIFDVEKLKKNENVYDTYASHELGTAIVFSKCIKVTFANNSFDDLLNLEYFGVHHVHCFRKEIGYRFVNLRTISRFVKNPVCPLSRIYRLMDPSNLQSVCAILLKKKIKPFLDNYDWDEACIKKDFAIEFNQRLQNQKT